MAQSRGATSKGSNSSENRNSLYCSWSRLSHNGSHLGRVGPRCKYWLLTHEKISVSHNNPRRPYFNCPDFPHGCDFFIWEDVDDNYVDQATLTDLYGQLQEQGQLIMEKNIELYELRSKQLYKKAFTTGFLVATVVWIVLIVLFVCVWKSMNWVSFSSFCSCVWLM